MTKANIDYSKSAVNLTNNEVVKADWQYLNDLECRMKDMEETIAASIPRELKDQQAELQGLIARAQKLIRDDIEEWGGYQDVVQGRYALKQEAEHLIYKPELVRKYVPGRVASFMLIESVDQKAMEAMLKTRQIDPETARKCAEIERTYRFIIK